MAQSVGLQLLLQPGITSPFFRIGCGAAAVLYPLYQTFKALDSSGTSPAASRSAPAIASRADAAEARAAEQQRLLTYWAAFGAVSLVLDGPLSRLPYYWHGKFAFLLWMHHEGARTLYYQVLQPALKKYERKLDTCIASVQAMADMVYSTYRVPINAATVSVKFAGGHVYDFLRWFFTDDGAAARPMFSAEGGAEATAPPVPPAPPRWSAGGAPAGGAGGGGLRGLVANAL